MVDLDVQIKSIQEKLQQLLRQQSVLQRENQKLRKDLERAQAESADREQSLHAAQQQLDALKLGAGGMLNEAEKAALGKRIDGYLKEIDKCLALLNT